MHWGEYSAGCRSPEISRRPDDVKISNPKGWRADEIYRIHRTISVSIASNLQPLLTSIAVLFLLWGKNADRATNRTYQTTGKYSCVRHMQYVGVIIHR